MLRFAPMWARRLRVKLIHAAIDLPLYRHVQGVVAQGPFQGMRYVAGSSGSAFGPKLLGTYEKELASRVSGIIDADYDTVINVGAAEGYYAVGLLTRMPCLHVLAYEVSDKARGLLEEMGRINHVLDRLDIRGWCDCAELDKALGRCSKALVICDIEGGEKRLLDPDSVPSLRRADILVELHDFKDRSISRMIFDRFKDTHDIETIHSRRRSRDDVRGVGGFNAFVLAHAANERRPEEMSWYWMASRVQPQ